jgi:hypothetical protein
MSVDENKTCVLRQFEELWNNGQVDRCRHVDLVLLVPATGLTGCGKRQMQASEGRGPSDRGVTNDQSVIIRELCKSPV